ncbi:MAG: sigma-70 family RNA polymerase sigma factor [Bacteroidota bacterium]
MSWFVGLYQFSDSLDDQTKLENTLSLIQLFSNNKNNNANPNITTYKGFEVVYNRYWDKMFQICYSQIRDEEIAAEILQNIFSSLWERKDELNLKGNIENYLMKSLKYRIFDHYKSEAKSLKVISIENVQQRSSLGVEEDYVYSEMLEQLEGNIEALPPQYKRAYKLRTYDGKSCKETAAIMGISERVVNKYLAKASQILKSKAGLAGFTSLLLFFKSL